MNASNSEARELFRERAAEALELLRRSTPLLREASGLLKGYPAMPIVGDESFHEIVSGMHGCLCQLMWDIGKTLNEKGKEKAS